MAETEIKHTFVVCAYKESRYLEPCIISLLNQNYKSRIIISTSTPNDCIQEIADRFHLPLFVNTGKKGIGADWNYAISLVHTELFTIAHQDDIYLPSYSEHMVNAYQAAKKPILLFCDYFELRNGITIKTNLLLKIKRMLLFPLRFRFLWNSRFIRRRILSLGSAICCPAVTMVKREIPAELFKNNMRSNIDWQAWEELSKKKGAFIFINKPLMKHRIHEESTTSALIAEAARQKEDLFMYQKFWPRPIARMIQIIYKINEKSNNLEKGMENNDGTDQGNKM